LKKLNVSLGNPLSIFFGNFEMPGTGLTAGGHWSPSRPTVLTVAVAGAVFAVLRELVCCFVRSSQTAEWIGRKTGALSAKG